MSTTTHLLLEFFSTETINCIVYNSNQLTQQEFITILKKTNNKKFNYSFKNIDNVLDGNMYIWN